MNVFKIRPAGDIKPAAMKPNCSRIPGDKSNPHFCQVESDDEIGENADRQALATSAASQSDSKGAASQSDSGGAALQSDSEGAAPQSNNGGATP